MNNRTGKKILLKCVEIYLSSCRLNLIANPSSKRMFQEGRQVITALWHHGLIYILYHFRKFPAAIMVSGSKDGQWVADVLKLWGQQPVRGSKGKGGLRAIKKMAELLKNTHISAGIVADGSKGPAQIAQKGAVVLARDTGIPIIPVGISAKPAYRFKSWDRMMLPMPFSKINLVYGPPLYVPEGIRGQAVEENRIRLERELNQATATAERAFET